jgi:hypothetical protein
LVCFFFSLISSVTLVVTILRQGEAVASIRYSTQTMWVPMEWYLTLPYLVAVGETLPPIGQCGTWMVKEIYRHFLQETMAVHMSLLHPPSMERRIFMDSDEN